MSGRTSFDPTKLNPLMRGKDGYYSITCRRLHLTYPLSLGSGASRIVESIQRNLGEKTSIDNSFAVEGTGPCPVLGSGTFSFTHLVIELRQGQSHTIRLNGTGWASYTDIIPHIRLIKGQWDAVRDDYVARNILGPKVEQEHALIVSPGSGVTYIDSGSNGAPNVLPPKAKRDVARYMRAKAAFDKFRETNTSLIREIFAQSSQAPRGNGHWYSYFDDAPAIADYLMMHDLAVAFQNCYTLDIVASELQKVCNAGERPPVVILCFSNGRPPDEIVTRIHEICEKITTGTLQVSRFRVGDVPLSTWTPHVFVFANFHPDIEMGFDNGHWVLSLPRPMNNTGHLIVPRECVESLVEAAKQHFNPRPEVIDLRKLLDSLRNLLWELRIRPGDLPCSFETVRDAARSLLSIFTPPIMMEYWKRGFQPVISVVVTFAQPLSDGEEVPEMEIKDVTVPFAGTSTWEDIYKMIGVTAKLGNVYVRSVPLSEKDKIAAAEKIRRMSLPALEVIEGIARAGGYPEVEAPDAPPLICDKPAEAGGAKAAENPFKGTRRPFQDFGPVNATEVYRAVHSFLLNYNAVIGYETPTPIGKIRSNGWFIEEKSIIVEIDMGIPLKWAAYTMLYWWSDKGYRTIRFRADEIIGPDWENNCGFTLPLERAIMDRSDTNFAFWLERVPSRCSWADFRESVMPYLPLVIGYELWWEDNIGPHVFPVEETDDSFPPQDETEPCPPQPRPQPGSQPSPQPSSQPSPQPSSQPSPQLSSQPSPQPSSQPSPQPSSQPNSQPVVVWAIYCRTTTGSDDLFAQRSHCLAYAKANSLVPIAGKNYFEDLCSADTAPNARPGLQAFLKSGATGMLCAHGTHLVNRESERMAVDFLRGRGVAFRAVDA
jgi:hypothetical protein